MSLHEGKFYIFDVALTSPHCLRICHSQQSSQEYGKIFGYALKPSGIVKDLGVQMSTDYTWNHHINDIVKGAQNAASWALGLPRTDSLLLCYNFTLIVGCRVEYFCPP